jgi:hypothetical protein
LLAELVKCADDGESIGETFDFSQTPDANADDLCAEKIDPRSSVTIRG